MGKMFLIIIDAHSKWLDIHVVNTATTEATVEKLRATFATHGLPEMLVSDNGSAFTSGAFREFLQKNGIQHVTSAPYHPSSNGLAERAVQTFKRGMKKQGSGSIEAKVARFLLSYRITPQATTGESPAQLRWGRNLRSHLDLLRPSVGNRVIVAQARQKSNHDKSSRPRQFAAGDTVQVRNYSGDRKWQPGLVIQETGPVSATVKLEDGTTARRHHDQLLARPPQTAKPQQPAVWQEPPSKVPSPEAVPESTAAVNGDPEHQVPTPMVAPDEMEIPPRRYPQREHKPPVRYR